jgi:hypothetical protein
MRTICRSAEILKLTLAKLQEDRETLAHELQQVQEDNEALRQQSSEDIARATEVQQ